MNGNTLQGWIAANSLARRTAEAILNASGRYHLARFDRLSPADCQRRILLGLVHQAQSTRFGLNHDFRRIRTVADYRRLVPLCTRSELWRDYLRPGYPQSAGATWPQRTTKRRSEGGDPFHLTPPSLALQTSHRSALHTALALANRVQHSSRFLSGTILVLSDEAPSHRTEYAIWSERIPSLLRPFTVFSAGIELEQFARLSVSMLIGSAEGLLSAFKALKQACGKTCLRDVWPQLTTVFFTGTSRHLGAAKKLRAEVGEEVLVLEMTGRAEGPLAVEDPQLGGTRLLFNHGVYFEFIPLDQAENPHCPRFGIEEIEINVPYEMVVASPAGLWACRIGRSVCLERLDPPLVRFPELASPKEVEVEGRQPIRRTDLIVPTNPLPQPHPQSDGSSAALPEMPYRSPWSILADQG